MFKYQHMREEDYWLYPIIFFNIVFVSIAIWASAVMFRGPAVVLGFLGIWFTSSKIRKGYSDKRAQIHVGLTVLLGSMLAFLIYLLTN